jgi:hypothetical protein
VSLAGHVQRLLRQGSKGAISGTIFHGYDLLKAANKMIRRWLALALD